MGEFPQDYQLISQKKLCRLEGLARSIQSDEKQRLQHGLLYPAKPSFRMEGQIKCFPDDIELKKFTIMKPLLYEIKGSI